MKTVLCKKVNVVVTGKRKSYSSVLFVSKTEEWVGKGKCAICGNMLKQGLYQAYLFQESDTEDPGPIFISCLEHFVHLESRMARFLDEMPRQVIGDDPWININNLLFKCGIIYDHLGISVQ